MRRLTGGFGTTASTGRWVVDAARNRHPLNRAARAALKTRRAPRRSSPAATGCNPRGHPRRPSITSCLRGTDRPRCTSIQRSTRLSAANWPGLGAAVEELARGGSATTGTRPSTTSAGCAEPSPTSPSGSSARSRPPSEGLPSRSFSPLMAATASAANRGGDTCSWSDKRRRRPGDRPRATASASAPSRAPTSDGASSPCLIGLRARPGRREDPAPQASPLTPRAPRCLERPPPLVRSPVGHTAPQGMAPWT